MYKIKAVLKSPLMIGGKTLNSNYRESRDYISGSVLRAAYAKALIQRCSYRQENYWLSYKGKEKCNECEFKTVCKNFAEISFPTLYPLGTSPYPVTARGKKYMQKGEKSCMDILKSRLIIQEKLDEEAGWERLEGMHKDGVKIELIYSVITRTAIDYCRNSAKEGSLYTQNVISEQCIDENNEVIGTAFSGEIQLSPQEKEELSRIGILYIGADITKGFGMCHMFFGEEIEGDTSKDIEDRICEFNSGIEEESRFVVLDLLTDAYLELEEIGKNSQSQTEISNEEFFKFLERKIGLPNEKYRLLKVFKFEEILRGFDTSKKTEQEMRRQGYIVVKAGAVFVYQTVSKDIDSKMLLELENQGIGKHAKHGFGKVRICDRFHTKYDVLKGENRNG